jgi:hypothetical protein
MPELKPRLPYAALFLLAMLAGCPGYLSAAARQQVYELPLPRAIGPGEALAARVTVGPLKPNERIVVRTGNGEIAGSISPFGAQARQSPGVYTIPLPDTAAHGGEVRLLVEVERKNTEPRAPTADEVRHIDLVYISVTKSGSRE